MMEYCLLVKLSGEINLKSHFVRIEFTKRLLENIKQALKEKQISFNKIDRDGGRFFIYAEKNQAMKMLSFLNRIFGIHSIALAQSFNESSLESISENALALAQEHLNKKDSFKIKTNRVGKHSFTSLDVSIHCADLINSRLGNKIDLTKPDKTIFIEIRQDKTFIYADEVEGFDGLPLAVSGRLLGFFSGSRQDLMAALMMMKRGCKIYFFLKGSEAKAGKALNKLNESALTDFKLIKASDLKGFIQEKNIKGMLISSNEVDKTMQAFNELKHLKIPVYAPLLLVPGNLINDFEKRFFS